MAFNRKMSGVKKDEIVETIYRSSAEFLDEVLTIIYRHAKKNAMTLEDGTKVIDILDLRHLIDAAVDQAYKKLDPK